MKRIAALCLCLLMASCSYSQNMMNPEGQVIRCYSWGWGIIGGTIAQNTFNDCLASHRQLGFAEFERVGVPGFILKEGSPPTILKVQEGLPADLAGMMAGDEFVSVNGNKVSTVKEVMFHGFCKPGDVVVYEIKRSGEGKMFSVKTIPKAR